MSDDIMIRLSLQDRTQQSWNASFWLYFESKNHSINS
jgi:hypothetical protein